MRIGQFDGDVVDVGPLHLRWPSFETMLMVYLESRPPAASADQRLAGQARVRLQAPGLVEQVFLLFLGLGQAVKPSRTMTWQVVQAQDFSQACSISMPFFKQAVADGLAGRNVDDGAVRAQLDMRQDDDLGHASS
jgi:hypothetical protein